MTSHNYADIPQPLGLFAAELYKRASEFLRASESIFANEPTLGFPGNFLLVHSIELFLKSYLASHEVGKRSIKKLGHDISVILEDSTALGLPEIRKLPELVAHIAVMNSDHDFRYPSGFDILMPTPQSSLLIVEELKDAIGRQIETARIKATLKLAEETRHLCGKKLRWSD